MAENKVWTATVNDEELPLGYRPSLPSPRLDPILQYKMGSTQASRYPPLRAVELVYKPTEVSVHDSSDSSKETYTCGCISGWVNNYCRPQLREFGWPLSKILNHMHQHGPMSYRLCYKRKSDRHRVDNESIQQLWRRRKCGRLWWKKRSFFGIIAVWQVQLSPESRIHYCKRKLKATGFQGIHPCARWSPFLESV